MKRLIIAGGTGYIGSALIPILSPDYELIILTRHPEKYNNTTRVLYKQWDGVSSISNLLEGAFGIINLVGENIGDKRWTNSRKRAILDSRIIPAQQISKSIQETTDKPKVWIQGSATGFYGPWNGTTPLNEYSRHADRNFLAQVCEEWEKPIQNLQIEGVRKIIIRTGVTIARDSALMVQFLNSFKFYVGGIVGSGRDYLPWIHTFDEVNAIKYLLDNDTCVGIYNLAAPISVTTQEFVKEIGHYKYSLLNVNIPTFILKLLFGKLKTTELILSNQKVYPSRLLDAGFKFRYNNIQQAMEQILKK